MRGIMSSTLRSMPDRARVIFLAEAHYRFAASLCWKERKAKRGDDDTRQITNVSYRNSGEKNIGRWRLTSVVFALLLIKSSLHFVPLQWTFVTLIGAAGRQYNGTLVPRLFVLGIVPLGDNCAFRVKANEIHVEPSRRAC